jgi:hypothetical protein
MHFLCVDAFFLRTTWSIAAYLAINYVKRGRIKPSSTPILLRIAESFRANVAAEMAAAGLQTLASRA